MAPVDLDWEALARTHVHPLRLAILELLAIDGGRTLSPTEMAFELRVPVGNVAYHVKVLGKRGFADQVGSRPVRGATEHFYALGPAARGDHRPRASRGDP